MDDPRPQRPLGSEVLQSLSTWPLTCCMDKEGADSSSFCQDLNPRKAVIGYHLGLDIWLPEDSDRQTRATLVDFIRQEFAISSPVACKITERAGGGEPLLSFQEQLPTARGVVSCDQEHCFHFQLPHNLLTATIHSSKWLSEPAPPPLNSGPSSTSFRGILFL